MKNKDEKNKKDESQSTHNEANTTYEEDAGSLVLSTGKSTANVWVLDSGASFHATSCRECFIDYQVGNFGKSLSRR